MSARDKAIEMVEEGLVGPMDMITMLVKYMSEDDVADCLDCNELSERFDDDYDDNTDDGYALASAGFGTEEDYE